VATEKNNLFESIPREMREEFIEALAGRDGVRVERIVSRGHTSSGGFWYDSNDTEWVIVIRGRARLRFEADDEVVDLGPGDHVTIPPHARHRVESTAPGQDTIWLAVRF
jgi:cupin 2 domain-containing protein